MTRKGKPLNPRQVAVLAAVRSAGGYLSTTEIRTRVNSTTHAPLVAEQVYQALLILERRGLVDRVHIASSVKSHWIHTGQATSARAAGQ